jgi:2-polyprenyl-3-methyl-5-hydroxy-6-metoxy-1,4-benzoquinol methylase
VDYTAKQAIQSAQYADAYHWSPGRPVDAQRYRRMTALLAEMVMRSASESPGKIVTILDVGCGDGYGSFLLWNDLRRHAFDVRLIGVDVDENAIRWARRKTSAVRASGMSFLAGTVDDGLALLNDSSPFLVVMLREVIEHLPEQMIDNIFSCLRGQVAPCMLIVSVPSVNSPVEKKHFRHYTEDILRETFRRNGWLCDQVLGFGFRPRRLYTSLRLLKGCLNRTPVLWRMLNPTWRCVSPELAITLIATGTPEKP